MISAHARLCLAAHTLIRSLLYVDTPSPKPLPLTENMQTDVGPDVARELSVGPTCFLLPVFCSFFIRTLFFVGFLWPL